MRVCIRCQTEMVEGCKLKDINGFSIRIVYTKGGVFTPRLGKTRIAVCPKCGEVSIYVENSGGLLEDHSERSIYD